MRIKSIFLAGILTVLFACSNNTETSDATIQATHLEDKAIVLDKLLGLWQNEDGKSFERWTKVKEGLYRSDGFYLQNKDTVFTENVIVREENGKWFSENTVFNQNQGATIGFTISTINQNELHFTNPAHDFPTDIHYQLVDDNTIHAFIAGPNQSGSKDTIPFNFTRVKN